MKICKLCGGNIEQERARLYCSNECYRGYKNNRQRETRSKRKTIGDLSKELQNNFYKVTRNAPFSLTTKGFNEVSPYGVQVYLNHFKVSKWLDIIAAFMQFEVVYTYVVSEYLNYYLKVRKQNMMDFCEQHPYITYRFVESIGIEKIMSSVGIKKQRYSELDYMNNFNEIKAELGRAPLYMEFIIHSRISVQSYITRFNIQGKKYDNIVKLFCSSLEYEQYLTNKSMHKTTVGKKTGKLAAKYTDKDFEFEFHKIFKYCLEKFNEYPSKRIFNQLSKFDDRSYRKKYGMSWLEVCKSYGYQVDKSFKAEKAVLNLISKITGYEYEHQKRFDWLKSDKGYKLPCDGYFPNLNLVVEFDGSGHRIPVPNFGGTKSLVRVKKNDEIRNIEIPKNGYKLLRIDSRSKWYDEEFMYELLQREGII